VAPVIVPHLYLAAGAGLVGGLGLLARGLAAYRRAERVEGIGTSEAASIAAGEVRLSGIIEPGPVVLVSPLQSVECVYYHAAMSEQQGKENASILDEERSVGFSVRDATGAVRVVPRGAHWFVAPVFKERTSLMGDEPPGLQLRERAWTKPTAMDRQAAIADLLTVHSASGLSGGDMFARPALGGFTAPRRTYREARLEPGQQVTIIGYAQAWAEINDGEALVSDADPAIAADLAEARAGGLIANDAAAAWGNAAIPGFGIGHPVTRPVLETGAQPLPVADAATRERTEELFVVPLGELVVAGGPDVPLAIHAGTPQVAASHERGLFLLGLAGALISVACALALVVMLRGGLS
jgi:hypothetical protein